MSREIKTLVKGGAYFEAPRWRDGLWWVADLYRKAIYTYSPDGEETKIVDVEQQPSGLGWLPDGSLIYVSQHDQVVYRRAEDGRVSVHADVSEHCVGDLNDMVVDGKGRAFVGHFGFDVFGGDKPHTASLIRIDADGSHRVVAEDVMFPNGSVIADDDRTLIVGEGMAGRYTAWTIEEDGSLSGRRDWAVLSRPPKMESLGELLESIDVIPDGCCLDAEGAIWVADAKNGRCIRVLEGGEIDQVIPAPDGQNIFACMLGGEDGKTLLLCVAPGLVDNDRLSDLAGTLRTVRVDVPGAGRP
jgi:sugar lactone lactonase YvrE